MIEPCESPAHAFPMEIRALAESVVLRLPPSKTPVSAHAIGPVRIDGELVSIPARIYCDPIPTGAFADGSTLEHRIAICLYTRHHDGHVRERFLKKLLPVRNAWEVPFVLQLIGEYVVEIISVIDDGLSSEQQPLFDRFIQENREFMELTRQRATSYWNCYYRYKWWRMADYPGMRVLGRLDATGIGRVRGR